MTIHVEARLAQVIMSDNEALDVAAELAPIFAAGASERDRERRLPWEEIEQFSRSGLWGITVPQAFGGAGVSNVTLSRIVEIISAADPSLGQLTQNHYATLERLRLYGSAEQRKFFFGRVIAGDRLGNATAEAGDKRPKDHQTRLQRTSKGLRLTGRKLYATGALFAHWVPVSAIDDEGQGVTVYVGRSAAGMTIVDDWSGFGQRTTASGSVLFEDVAVDGIQVFRNGLAKPPVDTANAVSQLVHSAIDLGIAGAAIEETKTFLRKLSHPARGSGVARAVDDPLTLRDIGDLTVRYHGAQALTERAAGLTDRARSSGATSDAAAAIVAVIESKIVTTEISLLATTKLFELAGTQSTLAVHNLDRHWRNARTHTLHDGVRWKYHAVGQFELNKLLCDPWTLGHPYSDAPVSAGGAVP